MSALPYAPSPKAAGEQVTYSKRKPPDLLVTKWIHFYMIANLYIDQYYQQKPFEHGITLVTSH